MKREKVSLWTMKTLVDVISNSGLSTISGSIDDTNYGGENEQAGKEINNEEEVIAAAVHIFKNIAQPGSKFMIKEEVDIVLPLIDVADTGQVDRKALTDWVVKVYQGRKALSHALNDRKTAVRYLERTPHYWHANHNVVVKEIENLNKIKMALFFNHTMNFQNFGEKNRRRTELILEMKKIFEEVNIKYDLLPQEVHLVKPMVGSRQ